MRRLAATALFVVGSLLAWAEPPTVTAQRTAGAITLDGRLDEPAWRDAQAIELTQQSPQPGGATPYTAEVRVLVTGDRVYFGFLCRDPEPGRIAVHSLQRDDEMSGDDTVAIVLDTYGDRRTGYYFRVNAAGARTDGLISNPESASLDWDGVWDARTARLKDGWSAEIVLPSRTLSFARGLDRWGLNLERYVPRQRMKLRWASPTLDAFLYDLSRAGTLAGVGDRKSVV